jgi:hypothetical protein
MPQLRHRYVVLCQRLLVVGTVAALAAPAVGVSTLDIVAPAPVSPHGAPHAAQAGPHAAGSGRGAAVSLVAAAPVRSTVHEYAVPALASGGLTARSATGAGSDDESGAGRGEELAALSAPEPVDGYATVGVTWRPTVHVDDRDITVSVRSRQDGAWSAWQEIEYHDEHAPDPGSREARRARPGTDPIVVGAVDRVQVKAETTDGRAPAGMRLAVVDPGTATDTVRAEPAIDTATLDDTAALSSAALAHGVDPNRPAPSGQAARPAAATARLSGAAADVTPEPLIYSRAQWGADERLRDTSSLHYYEIHAGFVHHTVNANGYTRKQVPALLRGIYAYHTRAKGWSDIGYNFVVDRFGRIWEGRYGGVARPVVGAHTLNYNENSFAMSALGNFEQARPSSAMLDAYGRLFAWKLSLHGVDASSTRQRVGSRTFQAINGHRDAGTTACPGRYLYAQLPAIRRLAASYQRPFTARNRTTDVAGSPWPDLVVRDPGTGHAVTIQTGGQLAFAEGRRAARGWKRMDLVAAGGDLTGDGIVDAVGRIRSTGVTGVYPGTAQGTFAASVSETTSLADAEQLLSVGDLDGDGHDDLVARGSGGGLELYPGTGAGRLGAPRVLAADWPYRLTAAAGDLVGDARTDLLARDPANRLWAFPGRARGLGEPVALPYRWGSYDLVAGLGDVTNDGRADLVARKRGSGLVYLYPGDGDGGFGHRYGGFRGFEKANFLAGVGQLAGSAHGDLLARVGARLVVFANTGNRNLERVRDTGLDVSGADLLLTVGDWNGDGTTDLMSRSRATGRMSFHAGNGRGGFATAVPAARGGRAWARTRLVAAVGDLTGDGYPDLVGQRGGVMWVFPGNGGTGFARGYAAHSAVDADLQAGSGLWDGDGSPDSVMRRGDGSLQLYPGNGPGGLTTPTRLGGGAKRYDWLQGVGDADGDGHADLVARERRSGTLWLLPGGGSGLGPRRYLASGFSGYDLG